MRTIRMILFGSVFIGLGLAIATFAVQNSESVTLTFFVWSKEYPLFLVLLFSFVVGVLLTGCVSLIEVFRLEARLRKSRRVRSMLEREIDALRNQPLYEEPPDTNQHSLPFPDRPAPPEKEEDEKEIA